MILTLFGSRAFFGIKKVAGIGVDGCQKNTYYTLGLVGHLICRRDVSYNSKNTKFTIKHYPSKPGGHFLEARRAFLCPRAAGVRNPDLLKHYSYRVPTIRIMVRIIAMVW